MHEEIKLKISQFLDEELGLHEALQLLQHLQQDPEAEEVFRRYAGISGVMKAGAYIAADAGFVTKVSTLLQNEPTVLCPPIRARRPKFNVISAAAASLAAMAVLVGGVLYYRDTQTAASGLQIAQARPNKAVYAEASQGRKDDERFNEYLEAHGATLYTGVYPSGRVYGQVASYGRK